MSNHSQNKTATAHHHTELEKKSERYLQCVLYLCHREHFTIALSKSGIVYITSITNRLVWCYSYSWLFPQNTAERNNSTTHKFYFFKPMIKRSCIRHVLMEMHPNTSKAVQRNQVIIKVQLKNTGCVCHFTRFTQRPQKNLFTTKDWFYEAGLGRVEWWERNWKLFQLFLQKDPVFQLVEQLAQEGGTITV